MRKSLGKGHGIKEEESMLRECVNYSRRKDRLSRTLVQVLEAVDRSGWQQAHLTRRNRR